MKKGKSRNKRKKTRSRLLWIAIAVIGIAAVISAVCVAGMLEFLQAFPWIGNWGLCIGHLPWSTAGSVQSSSVQSDA